MSSACFYSLIFRKQASDESTDQSNEPRYPYAFPVQEYEYDVMGGIRQLAVYNYDVNEELTFTMTAQETPVISGPKDDMPALPNDDF